MSSIPDVQVPAFPFPRPGPFDLPEAYSALRSDQPVTRVRLWNDTQAWLVTRYADVRALLNDRRLSAVAGSPGYPHVTPGREVTNRQDPSFIAMDAPEHARQRQMVLPAFTARAAESMRPQIQDVVDKLIDDLVERSAPADLVTELALPVPSTVICQLLGVPYEDRQFFHDRAAVPLSGADPAMAVAAYQELRAYLGELAATRIDDPGDDVLSTLAAQEQQGLLSPQDVASIALLLLVAGHETTANMIALGVFTLLQHREMLDVLLASSDPALMANAVDELLRYLNIVQYSPARVAVEDIEVDGEVIRAGDGVFLLISSANRDDAAFPLADTFDVRRPARDHLAFGHGVHVCLGQWLARAELEIVFTRLFRRLPGLALAVPIDDVPFKYDMTVFGVHSLPVQW